MCIYVRNPAFLIKILIAINFLEAAMSTWEYSTKYVADTGIFIVIHMPEKEIALHKIIQLD